MSKAEDAYIAATKDFIKAKQGKAKNAKAYNAAKEKLHKARLVWRAERDEIEGVSVAPATVSVKAAINNGG